MDGNLAQSNSRVEERKFMDAYSNYIVVDPTTAQVSTDKKTLVEEAAKKFRSIFRVEPKQAFWCYGYEVACAGPIPKK